MLYLASAVFLRTALSFEKYHLGAYVIDVAQDNI
jgi:hypothetical protein